MNTDGQRQLGSGLAGDRGRGCAANELATVELPSGPVVIEVSPLLKRAGIFHAFSTRIGGVSQAPYASLNFGSPMEVPAGAQRESANNIAENFARLQLAAGHVLRETSARELVEVYQVHGDACHTVYPHQAAHGPQSTTTKADAILTSDPARVLAIRTADCVPVLIATSDGRHVAAIHAGWRGVVAGIVPKVAAAVRAAALHDGRSAASLLVAIGPCISAAQFEVGPEVVTEFRRVFGDQAPVIGGGIAEASPADRSRIDLIAAIVLQLISAGLASPADISTSPHCTFADSNLFFSHRRDRGLTGRMASIIAPRGQ